MIWSLAFRRSFFHFDGDHRLIVERLDPSRVFRNRFEQGSDHALRRFLYTTFNDFFDSMTPKHISGLVTRVQYSIAEEYEHVAGFSAIRIFLVVGVVE